jgi:IS1 family transposase
MYIKKERRFVWLAFDRNTKRILAFKVGDRSEASLNDLLEDISHCKVNTFASDYYSVYSSVISGGKLIQGKAHLR